MVTIEEGNKLIAEWMHPEMLDREKIQKEGIDAADFTYAKLAVYMGDYSNLVYHESWNALMPVIEKIGEVKFPDDKYESGERVYIERCYPLTFGMKSDDGKYMFRFLAHQLFMADTLIEAAWLGVVNFIEPQKEIGDERN